MCYVAHRLGPNNLELAKGLIRCWYLDDGVTDPTLPSEAWLLSVLQRGDTYAYVALCDNEVVGGVIGHALPMLDQENVWEMFLYELGVANPHRRKGVARMLINELKSICHSHGMLVMYLGAESDNEEARLTYLNTGAWEEEIAWFTFDVSEEQA